MGKLNLTTPLEDIHGIGPNFLKKLKRLGIQTVRDLLWHFPTRYEDFSEIYKTNDLIPGQEATVQGIIKNISSRHSWRRNITIVEAIITDDVGSVKATWFNQPYIKNVLRPGCLANLSGKTALRNEEIYLSNPTFELVKGSETSHTARIVPIYPETRGLTSKGLRYLIKPLLENISVQEFIPKDVLSKTELPDAETALHQVHFPDDIDNAIKAKQRFAFEDLFILQLHNLFERRELKKEKARSIKTDIDHLKQAIENLPFELTQSQKQTLWEIIKDISKKSPMNRLLQGDVGSGKTIVAALAASEVARRGHQTAFMAPTEILARQHYKTLIKFFPDLDSGIGLLTSSEAKLYYGRNLESKINKSELADIISKNKAKIIIGTHALIQKNINFGKLALVVIDEQHRFGVHQRAKLLKGQELGIKNQGENKKNVINDSPFIPHFLSMSATPIPRTLNLTIFGDLDLSLITEMPQDRKPITTKVVAPEERNKSYDFIRSEVKRGRQVFVICPRITAPESEDARFDSSKTGREPRPNKIRAGTYKIDSWSEVKNVTEEYEKLSKKIFPDLKVAMLHGKLRPKEKEQIMNDFADGKTNILVSTSVVEVGVDIPNATIMMIEGSERFGLAQLYQFRGRVGRDKHQSYCLLFTDSKSRSTQRRLQSIEKAKNGFELAEKDLKIRGPGQFFGTTQSGMPDLAMKAIQNPRLVKDSREHAAKLIKKDPDLDRHKDLRERLEEFQKQIHKE